MTMTLTPEQFLAQPSDPDEDSDTEAHEPTSALESIAQSLWTLVGIIGEQTDPGGAPVSEADELRQALDQADAEHAAALTKLNEIAQIVKPSTSKLANAVRAVLDNETRVAPQEASASPSSEAAGQTTTEPAALPQPADDASIEEWRAYGASRGLMAVETLNRSMIRSALGIAQPVTHG